MERTGRRQHLTIELFQSQAINGLRVRVLLTSMDCIVEPALRQVTKPPKPVLDHFPHDRGIPGWPNAAERSWRRQAATERRRPDRHGEQPIIVVDRPSDRAKKTDVEAVRQAAGPHGNA